MTAIALLPLLLLSFLLLAETVAGNDASPTYHLLGLSYSEVNEQFSMCAFTMKVMRWCRILNRMNATYFVYANANTSPHCRNVVEIMSTATRLSYYGPDSAWRSGQTTFDQRVHAPGALEWKRLAIAAVKERMSKGDLILASFGFFHEPIALATRLDAVEFGVGYSETFAKYRIFESHTWLATATHLQGNKLSLNDAIMPMCYWTDEFYVPYFSLGPINRPYLAFVSRISTQKGLNVVLSILCALPEYDLRIAGTGVSLDAYLDHFSQCRNRVYFNGAIDAHARNVLVKQAVATLAPSLYNEPFGSIVVESQFLGTPVISTDHAGMSQTIWHGVTGYRCRTMRCFLAAARAAPKLDRKRIVEFAENNFNCEKMVPRITDYLAEARDDARFGWVGAPIRNVSLSPHMTYPRAQSVANSAETTEL